ncbi:MAG: hypothetical protein MJE77_40675 [Proteobacteria bacterium]|nr:hypothetical protein [Pseudomonadota bacterium]
MVALGVPLTFWLIGAPARRMAVRLDAVTPAELYSRRFDSTAVGILLFVVFTAYTLPYMVTAVKGAAVTLSGVTGGQIPQWPAAFCRYCGRSWPLWQPPWRSAC